jgi:putative hydrolases of HD superfamily
MINRITNLIFEAFHLKQVKHEGWRLAWIENPDSIAEHSLNAAQIWYILAKMEWADANKVAMIMIWHDFAETRIWDIHRIWTRYMNNKKEIENAIMDEQFGWLEFEEEIRSAFKEYEEKITLEWKIAKDADYLEMAFQAKIYKEKWYAEAEDWIANVWRSLRTESAKSIWNEMIKTSFVDWWKENKLKNLSNT